MRASVATGRIPLLGAMLVCRAIGVAAAVQTPPYQNEALPFDVRVHDLVSRMTLEEKVSQVKDVAPAIDRLGIPPYNWWNEALHGVARSEEHTSELQSLAYLVCRLLLEKKNI